MYNPFVETTAAAPDGELVSQAQGGRPRGPRPAPHASPTLGLQHCLTDAGTPRRCRGCHTGHSAARCEIAPHLSRREPVSYLALPHRGQSPAERQEAEV